VGAHAVAREASFSTVLDIAEVDESGRGVAAIRLPARNVAIVMLNLIQYLVRLSYCYKAGKTAIGYLAE
jgi:hypothetical protein